MKRDVSPRLRFAVLERDRFRCAYCGTPASETVLHVDHVVPVAAGGSSTADNLKAACLPCNLGKGSRTIESQWLPFPSEKECKALHEKLERERPKPRNQRDLARATLADQRMRIEVALSPEHVAILDAEACERSCSRADVIRDLIRTFLSQQEVRS